MRAGATAIVPIVAVGETARRARCGRDDRAVRDADCAPRSTDIGPDDVAALRRRLRADLGDRHRSTSSARERERRDGCDSCVASTGSTDARILYGGSMKPDNAAALAGAAEHRRRPDRRREPASSVRSSRIDPRRASGTPTDAHARADRGRSSSQSSTAGVMRDATYGNAIAAGAAAELGRAARHASARSARRERRGRRLARRASWATARSATSTSAAGASCRRASSSSTRRSPTARSRRTRVLRRASTTSATAAAACT